jgi:hypothetical protein
MLDPETRKLKIIGMYISSYLNGLFWQVQRNENIKG